MLKKNLISVFLLSIFLCSMISGVSAKTSEPLTILPTDIPLVTVHDVHHKTIDMNMILNEEYTFKFSFIDIINYDPNYFKKVKEINKNGISKYTLKAIKKGHTSITIESSIIIHCCPIYSKLYNVNIK